MKLAGLTQVQIAERTKLTQSYISRIRAGRYADLPGETMRVFAECFGCFIEDIFPSRPLTDADRRNAERRDGERRDGERRDGDRRHVGA